MPNKITTKIRIRKRPTAIPGTANGDNSPSCFGNGNSSWNSMHWYQRKTDAQVPNWFKDESAMTTWHVFDMESGIDVDTEMWNDKKAPFHLGGIASDATY